MSLQVARAIVNAEKHPNDGVIVLDDDDLGVLSRSIHDHASSGLTVTERNLAEEIDQVVTEPSLNHGTTQTPATEAFAAPPPPSSAGTC